MYVSGGANISMAYLMGLICNPLMFWDQQFLRFRNMLITSLIVVGKNVDSLGTYRDVTDGSML